MLEILAAIGEDPARPGLSSTPRRIAQSYGEFFAGLAEDPLDHLAPSADFVSDSSEIGELVLVRDIEFRSMCEHHLLPFTGVAHIAYLPNDRIVVIDGTGTVDDVHHRIHESYLVAFK